LRFVRHASTSLNVSAFALITLSSLRLPSCTKKAWVIGFSPMPTLVTEAALVVKLKRVGLPQSKKPQAPLQCAATFESASVKLSRRQTHYSP
jgi:hypothetical protein